MKPRELETLRRNQEDTFDATLTIQAHGSAGENPWGEPDNPAWVSAAPVPCRFGMQTDVEQFSPARDVVTADYLALVPFGTVVAEGNRVIDVLAGDNTTIEAGPLSVVAVLRLATHVRLSLRKVR